MGLALGVALLPLALALSGRPVRVPFDLPLPFFKRSVVWFRGHRPRDRRRAAALGTALVLTGLLVGGAAYPSLVRGLETLETLAPGEGMARRGRGAGAGCRPGQRRPGADAGAPRAAIRRRAGRL